FKFIKPLSKVAFVEEYENPAEKKLEDTKAAEAKTDEPKAGTNAESSPEQTNEEGESEASVPTTSRKATTTASSK
ncbi:MAG: hypothetical protein PXY39_00580, partial [archaeon]|nr:hypothetical protein [archaeon]